MNDKRDTKTPVKATKLTGPALQRAYENALHVLDRDAAILDQLRSRANILLAALAIGVTALGAILASATLHPHLPVWFVVLAVVFLGSAIFCCVGVLWPTRDHGNFTSPEMERARDEAAAAALIKAADAERDAAIAAGAETIGQARADAEALIRAAELELAARAAGLELGLVPPIPPPPPGSPAPGSLAPPDAAIAAAARQAILAVRTHAGNEEAWAAIAAAREARDEQRKQDVEAEKREEARDIGGALIRFAEADARARVAAAENQEAAIAAAQEAIGRVRPGAEALIRAGAEALGRAAEWYTGAAAQLADARADARARVADAADKDDAIRRGQEEIEWFRGHADYLIRTAEADAWARRQARADAESLIGAAEADAWACAVTAENQEAAIAAAQEAIGRVRPGAEALIRAGAEALGRAAEWYTGAAAQLADARADARARVADAADKDDAIRRGQEEIERVCARADDLIRAAAEARDKTVAEARDHAVAHAAVLERRRPLRERAGRAWKHLTQPWKYWGHALGRDQRLWKTVLGQQDLAQVPPGGSQDDVDRVLLESLYLAHERNLGTLSRRADLLRVASLLVFAFVVAFGIWLSTTTPSTSMGGHPSSTASATGRAFDLDRADTAANHAIAVDGTWTNLNTTQ